MKKQKNEQNWDIYFKEALEVIDTKFEILKNVRNFKGIKASKGIFSNDQLTFLHNKTYVKVVQFEDFYTISFSEKKDSPSNETYFQIFINLKSKNNREFQQFFIQRKKWEGCSEYDDVMDVMMSSVLDGFLSYWNQKIEPHVIEMNTENERIATGIKGQFLQIESQWQISKEVSDLALKNALKSIEKKTDVERELKEAGKSLQLAEEGEVLSNKQQKLSLYAKFLLFIYFSVERHLEKLEINSAGFKRISS